MGLRFYYCAPIRYMITLVFYGTNTNTYSNPAKSAKCQNASHPAPAASASNVCSDKQSWNAGWWDWATYAVTVIGPLDAYDPIIATTATCSSYKGTNSIAGKRA